MKYASRINQTEYMLGCEVETDEGSDTFFTHVHNPGMRQASVCGMASGIIGTQSGTKQVISSLAARCAGSWQLSIDQPALQNTDNHEKKQGTAMHTVQRYCTIQRISSPQANITSHTTTSLYRRSRRSMPPPIRCIVCFLYGKRVASASGIKRLRFDADFSWTDLFTATQRSPHSKCGACYLMV